MDNKKLLNNLRQKKFYENNSARIKEKKKSDREELKIFRKLQNMINEQETPIINLKKYVKEIHEIINLRQSTKDGFITDEILEPKKILDSKKIFDFETVINFLKQIEMNESTKRKYINDFKTLWRILNITHINDIFKSYKKVHSIIEKATQITKNIGSLYKINSKKGFVQTILFLIDSIPLNINKETIEKYKDYFKFLKVESHNETKENIENINVMSFEDYNKLILQKFGKDSKQYLISKLYENIPVRDNFNLKIVDSKNDITENTQNYLNINRKNTIIFLNKYKTVKANGPQKYILNEELTKLINNYIKNNNINIGDSLFSTSSLSSYISKMNKSLNIEGSINNFRKMAVSEGLLKINNNDSQGQIDLAKKLLHSTTTQPKYKRNISKL